MTVGSYESHDCADVEGCPGRLSPPEDRDKGGNEEREDKREKYIMSNYTTFIRHISTGSRTFHNVHDQSHEQSTAQTNMDMKQTQKRINSSRRDTTYSFHSIIEILIKFIIVQERVF